MRQDQQGSSPQRITGRRHRRGRTGRRKWYEEVDPHATPPDEEIRQVSADTRSKTANAEPKGASAVPGTREFGQIQAEIWNTRDQANKLESMLNHEDPHKYLGAEFFSKPGRLEGGINQSGCSHYRLAQQDPSPARRMLALQTAKLRAQQLRAIQQQKGPVQQPGPGPREQRRQEREAANR